MKRKFFRLGLAAGLVLCLCSCGQTSTAQGGPTRPAMTARPSSTAKLMILEPTPNSVITTTSLLVRFQLTGARIVAQTSTNLTPDTGHIHLSLDGRLISMNYQLQQEVSLAALTRGSHLLTGEFVAVDHAPFNPRVMTVLIFDYEPASG